MTDDYRSPNLRAVAACLVVSVFIAAFVVLFVVDQVVRA